MKKLLMIMAMLAVIGMAGMADAGPIVQEESAGYLSPVPGWASVFAAEYIEPAGGDHGYMYRYGEGIWTPGLCGGRSKSAARGGAE